MQLWTYAENCEFVMIASDSIDNTFRYKLIREI